jgi:predicted nucleic acid-binding protein
VILTDTGPLVALLNRNDPKHQACASAAKSLPAGPLITTWPCFTEAMYLVHRSGGYPAQAALWQLRSSGRLTLHDLSIEETNRMTALMDKYQDLPMDQLGLTLVFSLDKDFHIYRLANGEGFRIMP